MPTVTLERRYVSCEVRAADDADQRIVEGIAVPYDVPTDVGGIREVIAAGALEADEPIQLFWSHDHRTGGMPVGRVIEHRDVAARGDQPAGKWFRARISRTPKGDELLELLRDGVITGLSIGFDPIDVAHELRDGVETLVHTRAVWREVSAALAPVYPDARVTEVRSREEPAMPAETVTREQLDELRIAHEGEIAQLRDANADLTRRLELLADRADGGGDRHPLTQFRSAGEYVRAVATGQVDGDTYATILRDDATTDDSVARNAWHQRALVLVSENRRLLEWFDRQPLPAEGLSVDYPVVDLAGTDVQVAEQTTQATDLTYQELVITDGTAAVKTYGGYASVSRQVIERSSVPYLTTLFRAQAIAYAKATNAGVRSTWMAATTSTLAKDWGAWDVADWLTFLIGAAGEIEDQGLVPDFWLLSEDTFTAAATLLGSDGRPAFNLSGGQGQAVNTAGGVNAARFGGSIAGLPVLVDRNLPAGTVSVNSREAITTLESPGAPFRLQDDNAINLTRQFSVYGYVAIEVPFPLAIVKRIDEA